MHYGVKYLNSDVLEFTILSVLEGGPAYNINLAGVQAAKLKQDLSALPEGALQVFSFEDDNPDLEFTLYKDLNEPPTAHYQLDGEAAEKLRSSLSSAASYLFKHRFSTCSSERH